jgi:alpha-amylase/alpha-mannosidase (GH57 family)
MWPAEGGVSMETLRLLAEQGCRWAATGQGVLVNSLHNTRHDAGLPEQSAYLYRPYQVDGLEHLACFFRDDVLSDLIGFEYAKWYGSDAVNHFIQQLEAIWHRTPEGEEPVVSVIMDGENAWEYYPYNGYYFLSGLYAALQHHPFIRTTTFRDYLEFCAERGTHPGKRPPCTEHGFLPKLTAGSWVYGNFSTWIGDSAKNRAWDLLCAAKASFDMVMASGRLTAEEQDAARSHLSDCEGSDWFWWFGDYNPEVSVSSFDKLFRDNLAILYGLLKLPAPADLKRPICRGSSSGVEAGGTMRRST